MDVIRLYMFHSSVCENLTFSINICIESFVLPLAKHLHYYLILLNWSEYWIKIYMQLEGKTTKLHNDDMEQLKYNVECESMIAIRSTIRIIGSKVK